MQFPPHFNDCNVNIYMYTMYNTHITMKRGNSVTPKQNKVLVRGEGAAVMDPTAYQLYLTNLCSKTLIIESGGGGGDA